MVQPPHRRRLFGGSTGRPWPRGRRGRLRHLVGCCLRPTAVGDLRTWRPRLAQHPLTGFCLTATISCLRDSLILLCTPGIGPAAPIYPARNGSSAARARHSVDTGCRGLDTRSRSANCGSGYLRLVVCRRIGEWLDVIVSDGGKGAPSTRSEQIFFAERLSDYALTLLRRRLRGLYGRSFKLEVLSEMGGGTTVTMRIPLRVIALCTCQPKLGGSLARVGYSCTSNSG